MPGVFRRVPRPQLHRNRWVGTLPSAVQTITHPVLRVNATLPAQTIIGTGIASLTAPVVRVNANLPAQTIVGSGVVSLTHAVIRVNVNLPTQSIQLTLIITHPTVRVNVNLPGQTIVGSGVAILTAPIVVLNPNLPTQTIIGSGTASLTHVVVRVNVDLPSQTIVLVGAVVQRGPLTTQPVLTTITSRFEETLESAMGKLLGSLGCENIYPMDIPPIRTERELTHFLTVPSDLGRREAWFFGRLGMSTRSRVRGTNAQWEQIHDLRIIGLAWHDSFHRSYQYIQDQGDLVVGSLQKNIDMLMGSEVERILDVRADYNFEEFAQLGLHRVEVRFSALTLTSGDTREVPA